METSFYTGSFPIEATVEQFNHVDLDINYDFKTLTSVDKYSVNIISDRSRDNIYKVYIGVIIENQDDDCDIVDQLEQLVGTVEYLYTSTFQCELLETTVSRQHYSAEIMCEDHSAVEIVKDLIEAIGGAVANEFKITVAHDNNSVLTRLYKNYRQYINRNAEYLEAEFDLQEDFFTVEGLSKYYTDNNFQYFNSTEGWIISIDKPSPYKKFYLDLILDSEKYKNLYAQTYFELEGKEYLLVRGIDKNEIYIDIRRTFRKIVKALSKLNDEEVVFIGTNEDPSTENTLKKYNHQCVYKSTKYSIYILNHPYRMDYCSMPCEQEIEIKEPDLIEIIDKIMFLTFNCYNNESPGKIHKIYIATNDPQKSLKIYSKFKNKLDIPVLSGNIVSGVILTEDEELHIDDDIDGMQLIEGDEIIKNIICKLHPSLEVSILYYNDQGCLIIKDCSEELLKSIKNDLEVYYKKIENQINLPDNELEIFSQDSINSLSGSELVQIRKIENSYYNVKKLFQYVCKENDPVLPATRTKVTDELLDKLKTYLSEPNEWND